MTRNMWRYADKTAIMSGLMENMPHAPTEADAEIFSEATTSTSRSPAQQSLRLSLMNEFSAVASLGLLPHQRPIADGILNKGSGLTCLSGAGGAG